MMPPHLKALSLCACLALTLWSLGGCVRDPLLRKQKHNTFSAEIEGTMLEADSIAVFEEAVSGIFGGSTPQMVIEAYFDDSKIRMLEINLSRTAPNSYAGLHIDDGPGSVWGNPRDASTPYYLLSKGTLFVTEYDLDREASIQKIAGTFLLTMFNEQADTILIDQGYFDLVLGI